MYSAWLLSRHDEKLGLSARFWTTTSPAGGSGGGGEGEGGGGEGGGGGGIFGSGEGGGVLGEKKSELSGHGVQGSNGTNTMKSFNGLVRRSSVSHPLTIRALLGIQ